MSALPTPGFSFRVEARDGEARAGVLVTPHGEVPTPAFMPVGTQGSVKALTPDEVHASGARMILGNTYHLWVRPGPELVAEAGGLHRFVGWRGAMLTDSGGYQAFSLAERRTVSEDGFLFRSHRDGARLALTPEEAMRVQGLLGADVAMQLDVCPPAGATSEALRAAVLRTTRWAHRCLRAKRPEQALFAIVQGGLDVALRRAHAEELAALPVDGLALGGFSVGESPAAMHAALAEVAPALDPARPRYLMGVGTPRDLVRAIGAGVDLFDCVLPTRNARNGQAFTTRGRVVIKRARHRGEHGPLDPGCPCPCCAGGFSRAYLRHLFLSGEILAHRLLSQHNLHLYGALVRDARAAIAQGTFQAFARGVLDVAGEA